MKDFSIKLGFVPTRRLVFDKKEAQKHKNLIRDKLLSWKINLVDIDWLNQDGMLYDIKDVEKIYKYFLEKDVDALFLPHCNFGTESAVAKLGKLMNKSLLLWGTRDDAPWVVKYVVVILSAGFLLPVKFCADLKFPSLI